MRNHEKNDVTNPRPLNCNTHYFPIALPRRLCAFPLPSSISLGVILEWTRNVCPCLKSIMWYRNGLYKADNEGGCIMVFLVTGGSP